VDTKPDGGHVGAGFTLLWQNIHELDPFCEFHRFLSLSIPHHFFLSFIKIALKINQKTFYM
jgi:hypothetical protein